MFKIMEGKKKSLGRFSYLPKVTSQEGKEQRFQLQSLHSYPLSYNALKVGIIMYCKADISP